MKPEGERVMRISGRRIISALFVVTFIALAAGPSGEALGTVRETTRLSVVNRRLVDVDGRQVTLRGLVTLTADLNGQPLQVPGDLQPMHYAQMREWGFNLQQIRVQGCELGMGRLNECPGNPNYLQELNNMVTWAAAEGIYTIFKVTFYDIPSWWNQGLSPTRWESFWNNLYGQRDRFIDRWATLWDFMKNRPEVVGYDILNEPVKGTTTGGWGTGPAAVRRFIDDHLEDLYEDAAARLRTIDSQPLVFYQPMAIPHRPGLPMDAPDPGGVFAPHLYVEDKEPQDGIPDNLEGRLDAFAAVANGAAVPEGGTGVPMTIGEYGWPAEPVTLAGLFTLPARTTVSDRAYANALDGRALSSALPWYAYTNSWRVLNADGSEDVAHMNTVSRPFPARSAGPQDSWAFEFDAKVLEVSLPAGGTRATEVFVAAARHYPQGFRVSLDGVETPPGSPGVNYDGATETLVIEPHLQARYLVISPA